jgi:hypothetical protein
MKSLLVFISSVACVVFGAPTTLYHPLVYSAPIAVPAISQWHSQDALGQYSYGYQGGPSAKTEVKTLDGITQGSYSFIDANNQVQTVSYVSDALGFRTTGATNLPIGPVDTNTPPEPVEDTVEVKAAREEHLAAVKKAQNGESSDQEVEPLEAPEPVEDTVEVKAARAEHLKTVEEVKARNSLARDENTETVIAPQTIAVHASPLQTIAYQVHPHAAIQVAPAQIVLKSQPQTAFAYSVYQHAGIPHIYAV